MTWNEYLDKVIDQIELHFNARYQFNICNVIARLCLMDYVSYLKTGVIDHTMIRIGDVAKHSNRLHELICSEIAKKKGRKNKLHGIRFLFPYPEVELGKYHKTLQDYNNHVLPRIQFLKSLKEAE